MILLGTARVWSLVTSTTRFFPRASSRRRGVPTGRSKARRTISSWVPSPETSLMCDITIFSRFCSPIVSGTVFVS